MNEQPNPNDGPDSGPAGSPHAWSPPLDQTQRRPAASPTHSSRVRRLAAGAGVALVGVVGGVALIKVLPNVAADRDADRSLSHDAGHDDDRGDHNEHGDHDEHGDFGHGAPQAAQPGTQSQSSSGSS